MRMLTPEHVGKKTTVAIIAPSLPDVAVKALSKLYRLKVFR
jgi:hypothetical protein